MSPANTATPVKKQHPPKKFEALAKESLIARLRCPHCGANLVEPKSTLYGIQKSIASSVGHEFPAIYEVIESTG